FKGNFDFDDIKITERKKYCKFYLELTYEKNGVVETIRSTRMLYEQKEQKMGLQRSLISYHGTKFRVEVKHTKKSKYLSLQMTQYNIKNELVTKLRSQWIKLRRSKSIEKFYKNLFYILGKLVPTKKDLVVFESFLGKQYSDNPRAIYEYMVKNKLNY